MPKGIPNKRYTPDGIRGASVLTAAQTLWRVGWRRTRPRSVTCLDAETILVKIRDVNVEIEQKLY